MAVPLSQLPAHEQQRTMLGPRRELGGRGLGSVLPARMPMSWQHPAVVAPLALQIAFACDMRIAQPSVTLDFGARSGVLQTASLRALR